MNIIKTGLFLLYFKFFMHFVFCILYFVFCILYFVFCILVLLCSVHFKQRQWQQRP